MVDDVAPAATGTTRCPWCSAELPAAGATDCVSCGATLVADSEPQLPGVTALDAEAIVRAARQPTAQRRNRLLSWISGEYDPGDEPPPPPGSLAPPAPEVQREMLRLELEAEVANLQGEASAMLAEAGIDADEPGDEETSTTSEAESSTAAEAESAVSEDAPPSERA